MSPLVRALKAKYGNDKQKVMRLLGIDAELLKNASEEGRAESSKPLPRDDVAALILSHSASSSRNSYVNILAQSRWSAPARCSSNI